MEFVSVKYIPRRSLAQLIKLGYYKITVINIFLIFIADVGDPIPSFVQLLI